MPTTTDTFSLLTEKLLEISHLKSTLSVLHWDTQVNMPKNGAGPRATTVAYLTGLVHEKSTSKELGKLVSMLKKQFGTDNLTDEQEAVVREVDRELARERKLPTSFVKEMAKATEEAHAVWTEARATNNFALFLPHLERIVDLKRQEAEYVGYTDSPYDALIDCFEPGMTTAELTPLLAELKDFLVPLLKQIKASSVKIDPSVLTGDFPLDKQMKCNCFLAKKLGYDFECGRIDTSTHPFSTLFHPQDVRITTRFDTHNLFYALDTTTHEVGHALYDQGFPLEYYGTPLCDFISYGIHESQSRLWEVLVGKGKPFWRYFYSRLRQDFGAPFTNLPFNVFYRSLNAVTPSLIRTEADEVTYNLHIILRYEIEKGLIEGTIAPRDLPAIWNQKMKEYLGIRVPSDSFGVLQDVHWSAGYFGYFPSYTLGNLYSVQFYEAAKRDILNLEKEIAAGHFEHLREWLRKNIHTHGRRYSATELVLRITGEPLSTRYFTDYLRNKYTDIYKIPSA